MIFIEDKLVQFPQKADTTDSLLWKFEKIRELLTLYILQFDQKNSEKLLRKVYNRKERVL